MHQRSPIRSDPLHLQGRGQGVAAVGALEAWLEVECAQLVQSGLTPASIAVADLDLDGCPDIVASFRGVKGIVTLTGQCQMSE